MQILGIAAAAAAAHAHVAAGCCDALLAPTTLQSAQQALNSNPAALNRHWLLWQKHTAVIRH